MLLPALQGYQIDTLPKLEVAKKLRFTLKNLIMMIDLIRKCSENVFKVLRCLQHTFLLLNTFLNLVFEKMGLLATITSNRNAPISMLHTEEIKTVLNSA